MSMDRQPHVRMPRNRPPVFGFGSVGQLLRVLRRGSVALAISAGLTACGEDLLTQETTIDAVRRVEAEFDAMFKQTRHVVRSGTLPYQVYSGSSAAILTRTPVRASLHTQLIDSEVVLRTRGLARTAKGNYFLVSFVCRLAYTNGQCGPDQIQFRPVQEWEAKDWLLEDPELFDLDFYRTTFGEYPPVTEELA